MKKFKETLLSDYMGGFWGYGNLSGDYWFVGMEEGGGDSFDEVNQRVTQWDRRGRNSFEDLYEYHKDISIPKWFRKKAPLQSTWNRLIRVLLVAKGEIPEREVVRSYQIEKLGRSNGEVCLMELLPLPSPSMNHWMYSEHTDIPFLSSREEYTKKVGVIRAKKITELIRKYQPTFVMFYGIGYLDWWEKVADTKLTSKILHNKIAYFGKLGNTAVAVSQHPVAQGVSLDYFHDIGRNLSEI